MLVKLEAIRFIRIVCVKSAMDAFRHVNAAHLIKYTGIGSMKVDKNKNSFISSEVRNKYASAVKAIKYMIPQKIKVPRTPRRALIVVTPSLASALC